MKINLNNSSLLISAGLPKQFPALAVPQVAFSGRSNVGKSSLINTLLQRKSLARVSGTPGKTVTVNFYSVDQKLLLVDLPGYGFAKRTFEEKKKWSALTDAYFTGNNNIDLLRCVVQLIDGKVGPTADDRQMLDYLTEAGLPFIIVYTKVDKLNATQKNALKASLGQYGAASAEILYSSETKEGREEVWSTILKMCE
ncbi:MAG: YihA family ribosome biogenesis GTP-binding protein [Ruminococcaceae bacterium]|nr:YihA family ribosome biogenesis GTP-binding protein [Oscillospiraceae bacterium]